MKEEIVKGIEDKEIFGKRMKLKLEVRRMFEKKKRKFIEKDKKEEVIIKV